MKVFLSGLLGAALSGALQGGAAASQQPDNNLKTTGVTALIGTVAGVFQYLLQHPATSTQAKTLVTPTIVMTTATPTTPKAGD